MKFDLVELLEYAGIKGSSVFWVLLLIFICWVLFSSDKASEKMNLLYKNNTATIFLDRKHKKYEQLLTTLQSKNTVNL